VTPGSLVEDTMLTPEENNYLASLFVEGDNCAFAWADLSTGEFLTTCTSVDKIASTILRCAPKEIILPSVYLEKSASEKSALEDENVSSLYLPIADEKARLSIEEAIPHTCMKTFRPLSTFQGKEYNNLSLKEEERLEKYAAASILEYLGFTQKRGAISIIKKPMHVETSDHMIIDTSAWKSLEITKSLNGTKSSSLLDAIDKTCTAAGSRLLVSHLTSPLMNLEILKQRLDVVSYFIESEQYKKGNPSTTTLPPSLGLHRKVRDALHGIADIERSIQRLILSVGTPKDLKNIATTIQEAKQLSDLFFLRNGMENKKTLDHLPILLAQNVKILTLNPILVEIAKEIQSALKEEDFASLNARTGFVRTGFSKELDEWRLILHHQHQPQHPFGSSTVNSSTNGTGTSSVIHHKKLEQDYRQELGTNKLRVCYQAGRGFFVEISHEENKKITTKTTTRLPPINWHFFHSTKNYVRYRTTELDALNLCLAQAAQQIDLLELEIFDTFRQKLLDNLLQLQKIAQALAQIDVFCSHAYMALDQNFTRPFVDSSWDLHIEDGRHTVVEKAHLKGKNSKYPRAFVPNSLHLGPLSQIDPEMGTCWLLTGPNMGGKSTFLRQNAHIVILAQIGSFVPARFARVGLVDKIFCRVGSADDLASDKSTFMVEMQETATILKQATSRSLVLMDEVGRGTSVNDGLAIAGAVLEDLCQRKTRTLFASHFTALSELAKTNSELKLYRMEVLELGSNHTNVNANVSEATRQLVFSHKVVQGLAPRSYGITTAALAGCPPKVLARAEELLQFFPHKAIKEPTKQEEHVQIRQKLLHIQAYLNETNSLQDPAFILFRIRELLNEEKN
jgi:DNA mismatch repair protein MutS